VPGAADAPARGCPPIAPPVSRLPAPDRRPRRRRARRRSWVARLSSASRRTTSAVSEGPRRYRPVGAPRYEAKGRSPRVTAEQLDDEKTLVRAATSQIVDEVDRAGDGGREADAVVGAVDVVVHGLGTARRPTPSGAGGGEGQRVPSPADRHQDVQRRNSRLSRRLREVDPALRIGSPTPPGGAPAARSP